jgi:phosphatidate cytidylyltransferase
VSGDASAVPATPAGGAETGPERKSGSWALGLRIGSGVLFVPLLVLLARAGGLAFAGFVALEVVLGQTEFYRMMRGKGLEPWPRAGILGGLGVVIAAYRPYTSHVDFLVTMALLLVLALGLRTVGRARVVESMAVTLFGVLYVAWLSAHLVLLRELPWRAGTAYAEGAWFVLLAFFITWSCDSGAYIVGRMLGRHRLSPISPRKSVEGAIGGLLFAVAGAYVARAWFAPFLSGRDALALGLLVGLFAQVGDLVESMFKRDAAAGDSSDIIPGHGGILDRFDSLYFGAPLVYYYLKIVVYQVP